MRKRVPPGLTRGNSCGVQNVHISFKSPILFQILNIIWIVTGYLKETWTFWTPQNRLVRKLTIFQNNPELNEEVDNIQGLHVQPRCQNLEISLKKELRERRKKSKRETRNKSFKLEAMEDEVEKIPLRVWIISDPKL